MLSFRSLASLLLFTPLVACSGQIIEPPTTTPIESASPAIDSGSPAPSGTLSGAGDGVCGALTIDRTGAAPQPTGACVCTRRDANPAGDCPRGVGQSASAMIGPEGGTISLEGQAGPSSGVPFTLTIPPAALATTMKITVTELATPPPEGVVDWSPYYRIEPVDLALAAPASIMVPTSNGRGSALSDEHMKVFASGSSACALEPVGNSYNNAGFMNAKITRLGYLIAGYANVGAATYCQ